MDSREEIVVSGDDGLPRYVDWPIFPFEGELRIKPLLPPMDSDWPRAGEPGGAPCPSCRSADEDYIWVDDHWRVRATETPPSLPVVLFLETRAHVDLRDLDDGMSCELGQLLVRLDWAVGALDGVGRTHVNRWGDGGSHFHMWIYGRPFGSVQALGFGVPLWAEILPPIDEGVWRQNLATVAAALERSGGRAIAQP